MIFSSIATVCFQALLAGLVHGYSETVVFTKLTGKLNIISVIIDKPFTIDCSVNRDTVKVSLYKRTNNGKKELVKPDGKLIKRHENKFEIVARSFSEGGSYYCVGELYGTKYEREVIAPVVATSAELTPVPEVYPINSKVTVGGSINLVCSTLGRFTVHTWYKNGKKITPDKRINIRRDYDDVKARTVSKSELFISDAVLSDSGVYACKATTTLQNQYASATDAKVEVKEATTSPLEGIPNDEVLAVKKYSTAILNCTVPNKDIIVEFYRHNPFGSLDYLKAGKVKYEFKGRQKLAINLVTNADIGLYVCKAEGVLVKRISLFVIQDAEKICRIFRPQGMRTLCKYSKHLFKKYIDALMRQL